MKIMIPLSGGILTPHFGHCQEFALIDLIEATGEMTISEGLTPPPHEPGILPRWIADQGADLVIAGGLGQKARIILEKHGVMVVTGAPSESPEIVVELWRSGEISGDGNFCSH